MKVDAKGYLLEVARDPDFTQALPAVQPAADPKDVERVIRDNLGRRGSYDALMSAGTSALSAGRSELARDAFDAASRQRPSDWRPPYLAGLAAQADGDLERARALFVAASQRANRPEILTSLAIIDVRLNDPSHAVAEARSAVQLDAAYGPAQFTAGMLALASGDAVTASQLLEAALALGHAPERTSYFLDLARRAT
jgi:Flp pilus assembly protein TadD